MTLNVALPPAVTLKLLGCDVMIGEAMTASIAGLLVSVPAELETRSV